jgi:hypothetical protein
MLASRFKALRLTTKRKMNCLNYRFFLIRTEDLSQGAPLQLPQRAAYVAAMATIAQAADSPCAYEAPVSNPPSNITTPAAVEIPAPPNFYGLGARVEHVLASREGHLSSIVEEALQLPQVTAVAGRGMVPWRSGTADRWAQCSAPGQPGGRVAAAACGRRCTPTTCTGQQCIQPDRGWLPEAEPAGRLAPDRLAQGLQPPARPPASLPRRRLWRR